MAIKIRKKGDPEDGEGDEEAPQQAAAASDPMMGVTARTASWIGRNPAAAVGGIVAILVAVIGVYGGMQYMENQTVKAADSLAPSFVAYAMPIKGTPTFEQLQKAEFNIPKAHDSYEAKWTASYEAANETLSNSPKSEVAQPARLAKAAAAIRLEKWDEAVTAYEAYLDGKYSGEVEPFVRQGLATAYAGKGDIESARKQLQKLAESDEKYKPLAKYQEAKLLQAEGKVDEAKELYHEIIETNPKTPFKSDIERRLALL